MIGGQAEMVVIVHALYDDVPFICGHIDNMPLYVMLACSFTWTYL